LPTKILYAFLILPYVLHALPTSCFLIWSSLSYSANSQNDGTRYYAFFQPPVSSAVLGSNILFSNLLYNSLCCSHRRDETVSLIGPVVHPPGDIWAWRSVEERYWHRKPNNSVKNLSQCHFVHHKFQTDWPDADPSFRGERQATNHPSYGTAFHSNILSPSFYERPSFTPVEDSSVSC
jgi:hypothetical protein